jgi:hypothetical protein
VQQDSSTQTQGQQQFPTAWTVLLAATAHRELQQLQLQFAFHVDKGSGATPSLPRLNQRAPIVQQECTTKIRRQQQFPTVWTVPQVATATPSQRRRPQFAQFAAQGLTAVHHRPPAPTAPSDII